MKKTLLSIVALVAMVVAVASCNGTGKLVDAQVKAIEAIGMKIDSVQTMDQLQAVGAELAASMDAFAASTKDAQLSEEDNQKLAAAQEAVMAKAQPLSEKFMQEAAAAAEAAALAEAEALAAAEAEAAKTKGKKK